MELAPLLYGDIVQQPEMDILAGACRILAVGSFLTAAGLSQQPAVSWHAPSVSSIANLLLGDDPRLIARGAHYAIASSDPALESDLLRVAADWQTLPQPLPGDLAPINLTDDQLERRDAIAAVLDALIQKNVQVPADTLKLLASDFENYVAILLARLPLDQSQDLAFDLYRHRDGSALQYVSAALLAQNPPPGYAADLISGIRVHAVVFVIRAGSDGSYGYGYGGCYACSGIPAPRKGWPNFGIYSLSRQRSPGAVPVLSRPDPLYASRKVITNRLSPMCPGIGLVPEDRRRFLAYMLGIQPESIPWGLELTENIPFSSEPQFESDLHSFIDSLEEQYRATANELEEKGLITAEEESDALPLLNIHLLDERGEGYPPLPSPHAQLPHVTWTNSL